MTTLAEVLEAKARWDAADNIQSLTDRANYNREIARARFADAAAEFFGAHCEALERFELERAARAACGATERNQVVVDKGNAAPYLFESNCLAVAVGADWRPGVKP